MNIILSGLNSNRQVAEVVGIILDQKKDRPIYFVGHHPSDELVSVIDAIVGQGYFQNVVITNMTSKVCECGGQDCACKMLKIKLLPENLFIFDELQHPDLVKIVPKLGDAVMWVINTNHPQKDELVQWISS